MSKRVKVNPEPTSSVETYRDVRGYWLNDIALLSKPSCFNGMVNVRRFKVTVELIDEPKEVIAERLEALWRSSDNCHDRDPLKAAAEGIGYDFTGKFGEGRDRG